MSERIGIMTIGYFVLEQALHLPEGHRIRGIRLVDNFSDTFEICVEGPLLPERTLEQPIPRVVLQVTVSEGESLVPVRTFIGKFEETRS